jgi:hypothetical protein
MFGLTKQEQRWKAEQQAAETLTAFASVALQAAAQIRVAEAQTDADELARLRAAEADFHIEYRLKCDVETKAQAQGIERLRAALKQANSQAEHFEREWYLRGDAIETARPAMREYAAKNPMHHFGETPQDPNGVHAWLAKFGA